MANVHVDQAGATHLAWYHRNPEGPVRGHPVTDNCYDADGVRVEDEPDRPCVHCGERPVLAIRWGRRDYDDFCVAGLPGAIADVCCGHGEPGVRIDIDGEYVFGDEARGVMRSLGGCPPWPI